MPPLLELSDKEREARRPFRFQGRSGVAVLCLHGFTGSPAEMRPLAEHLAVSGHAAHVPLLPKHGDLPENLRGVRWTEWTEAARQALQDLEQKYEHLFIAGLSMGGLIALWLAAEHPSTKLRGLIVMGAPYAINDARTRLVGLARFFVPYYYPLRDANWEDPEFRANLARRLNRQDVNFDDPAVRRAITQSVRIPVDAIHQLICLNQRVIRLLPRVTTPVVFMQGRRDRVVSPQSAEALAAGVASTDKRVIWYENSAHELPIEPDAPVLFADVLTFIKAQAQRAKPALADAMAEASAVAQAPTVPS
ncbi:MAG: alpha/beta hydrolase [Thermoflexales bacterium]